MLYDLWYTRENVFTGPPFRFKWTRDGQRERERVARSAKLRREFGWLRLVKERGGFRFFCPLFSIRFSRANIVGRGEYWGDDKFSRVTQVWL